MGIDDELNEDKIRSDVEKRQAIEYTKWIAEANYCKSLEYEPALTEPTL